MEKSVLLWALTLFLGVSAASEKVLQRDEEFSFMGINRHSMYKLKVAKEDEIEGVLVNGEGQCMLKCLLHDECVSMNLESSTGEKKMCHLLKSDIHRAKKGSLVKDSAISHYSIPVRRFSVPTHFTIPLTARSYSYSLRFKLPVYWKK